MTRTLEDLSRECIAPILILALAMACWAGCNKTSSDSGADPLKTKDSKGKTGEPDVVIPVEAAFPTREDISSYFETTARVVAERRVEVMSEGLGECMKVNVEEGDTVTKGQVLAELDKEEPLAALRQLEIQTAQSKTAYEIAEKSLAEGLGAKVERDNARFGYEQAEATLAAQRLKVDNLTICAPIDGLITRRNIQKGQMVSLGMPVFSIVDPASFMIEINPPEKELSRLKEGQPARVNIDALGGEEFTTAVRRINPAVDPMSGTIKVVLDFPLESRRNLREAAFARVRLVMDTHLAALVLPKDALVEENGRKYLFVVKEQVNTPEKPKEASPAANNATAAKKEEEPVPEPKDTPPPKPENGASAGSAETNNPSEGGPAGSGGETPQNTDKVLVSERIEVQTGFEDSYRVEILSGIQDDSLVVTLGQHTVKSGVRVSVTNAETLLEETSKLPAEDALKAAKEARAKQAQKQNQ
jgi:membrane fusion protein (multidrug efflux system)